MNTFKLKTYNMKANTSLPEHHFFILSKGYNAGKPLDKPCPNCFIIWADTAEEKGKLFWICYALWKSESYLPLLVGSVIPFLHIKDISNQLAHAMDYIHFDITKFDVKVNQLQTLTRTEKLLQLQLKLISEIKFSITRQMIKIL